MAQDIDTLTLKLEEFNYTLQFIKKIQDQDDCNVNLFDNTVITYQETNNKVKLDNNYEKISNLVAEIKQKFKKGKFKHEQKFKKQKLEKDFEKKVQLYVKLLEARRATKLTQLGSLRQRRETLIGQANRNGKGQDQKGKKGKKKNESSDQDEAPKQIQLQQVNQQTLYYQRMIELKEKELLEVKDKMEAALNVQKDIGRLVNQQGDQLDIAEANIDSARENVKQAGDLLEEGKKQHKSANKKKLIIAAIIFVLLLVILVPILIKFT